MFYCESCRERQGWPRSLGRSYGRCEVCSTDATFFCWSLPSSRLSRRLDLPEPECLGGYTRAQVSEIVGPSRLDAFNKWMSGQMIMLCEGRRCPQPHGAVVYQSDVERFLRNGPAIQ